MQFQKPDVTKQDLKVQYTFLIYSQVNRIMLSFGEGDPKTRFDRVVMNIDALEDLLTYYHDSEYTNNVRIISNSKIPGLLKYLENQKIDLNQEDLQNIDYIRARLKLKEIMKLIGRRGFYPDQDIGATEEEGVYEEYGEQYSESEPGDTYTTTNTTDNTETNSETV